MFSVYRSAAAAIASVLIASSSASAATILYSSQSSFLAAVGTSITDDYSNAGYVRSFGPNPPNFMSDAYMTSVLNQTTYKDTKIPLNNNEVIGPLNGTGNPYYCAGCNGSFDLGFKSTTLTTGGGVFGVSFNYRDGGLPGAPNNPLFDVLVTFGDGSTTDYTVPQSAPPGAAFATDFWGITSDKQIADIYFGVNGAPASSAIFGLDNLTIAAKVAAVPEPASLALFASGLLGFGAIRRRRIPKA